MPRLVSKESNFVDETRLIGANCAFVDFLAVVVVNHVLLEMSFVSENFSAESASDFIHDVRVAEMIFQDAF